MWPTVFAITEDANTILIETIIVLHDGTNLI